MFRAIRKVYASFYNENAFLERLRHGVIEAEVGVAILVHFSVSDADEMVNGVATLSVEMTAGRRAAHAQVVSQLGAESVTNPDVSIRPEGVSAAFTGVDPAGLYGSLFGLIQTYQGEFGSLMARHRLKTRLWLYKSKGAPHNSIPYTPAAYWRKLFINLQHLEDGRVRTWAGVLEDLGTVATPASQRMTVTWTSGNGGGLRTYLLTLDFPYGVNANRTAAPFPSDPAYSLKFSTDSYFARTLLPGHHNFFDIVLLEPALDPAVPENTRAALVQANIRQVYTFKDLAGVTIGGNSEDIHFIGFDNVFRRP